MRHSDVLAKVGGGKSVMLASLLQASLSEKSASLGCGDSAVVGAEVLLQVPLENLGEAEY